MLASILSSDAARIYLNKAYNNCKLNISSTSNNPNDIPLVLLDDKFITRHDVKYHIYESLQIDTFTEDYINRNNKGVKMAKTLSKVALVTGLGGIALGAAAAGLNLTNVISFSSKNKDSAPNTSDSSNDATTSTKTTEAPTTDATSMPTETDVTTISTKAPTTYATTIPTEAPTTGLHGITRLPNGYPLTVQGICDTACAPCKPDFVAPICQFSDSDICNEDTINSACTASTFNNKDYCIRIQNSLEDAVHVGDQTYQFNPYQNIPNSGNYATSSSNNYASSDTADYANSGSGDYANSGSGDYANSGSGDSEITDPNYPSAHSIANKCCDCGDMYRLSKPLPNNRRTSWVISYPQGNPPTENKLAASVEDSMSRYAAEHHGEPGAYRKENYHLRDTFINEDGEITLSDHRETRSSQLPEQNEMPNNTENTENVKIIAEEYDENGKIVNEKCLSLQYNDNGDDVLTEEDCHPRAKRSGSDTSPTETPTYIIVNNNPEIEKKEDENAAFYNNVFLAGSAAVVGINAVVTVTSLFTMRASNNVYTGVKYLQNLEEYEHRENDGSIKIEDLAMSTFIKQSQESMYPGIKPILINKHTGTEENVRTSYTFLLSKNDAFNNNEGNLNVLGGFYTLSKINNVHQDTLELQFQSTGHCLTLILCSNNKDKTYYHISTPSTQSYTIKTNYENNYTDTITLLIKCKSKDSFCNITDIEDGQLLTITDPENSREFTCSTSNENLTTANPQYEIRPVFPSASRIKDANIVSLGLCFLKGSQDIFEEDNRISLATEPLCTL